MDWVWNSTVSPVILLVQTYMRRKCLPFYNSTCTERRENILQLKMSFCAVNWNLVQTVLLNNTVNGRNPAPPGMCKNLVNIYGMNYLSTGERRIFSHFFHQQYDIQSKVPELTPKKSPPTKLPVLIAAGRWHPHDLRAWSYHRHLSVMDCKTLKTICSHLWNTEIASKKELCSVHDLKLFRKLIQPLSFPVVNSHSSYIILKLILYTTGPV